MAKGVRYTTLEDDQRAFLLNVFHYHNGLGFKLLLTRVLQNGRYDMDKEKDVLAVLRIKYLKLFHGDKKLIAKYRKIPDEYPPIPNEEESNDTGDDGFTMADIERELEMERERHRQKIELLTIQRLAQDTKAIGKNNTESFDELMKRADDYLNR